MLRKDLDQKHPDYDADTWDRYWALYKGGKTFRANVAKFLPKNELEPEKTYGLRKRAACYRSYVGPVVDYFAAALFTSAPIARAKDSKGEPVADVDQFYSDWKEDADGNGCDFHDFLRARFRDMLVRERAWWLVEMPADPEWEALPEEMRDRADWRKRGLDRACLRALKAQDVFDWECDDRGRILWAITFSRTTARKSPTAGRNRVRDEWTVYDETHVETFAIEYAANKKPSENDDIPSEGRREHGFKRTPLVPMPAPDGLWLLDRVHDAQVEHFNLSSGLGWAIRRTCYAMPVFAIRDRKHPPEMGTGYYLMIGENDKMEWAAPPSAPFDTIATEVKSQKDEIYRVAQQMALGVENNAAAVGRSADSKTADASATMTCLHAYAAPVRQAAEFTYELLSEGRGESDEYRWSIEGLDKFNLADAALAVANATQANMLDIPSRTFKRELHKNTADALLPGIDQKTRDIIHKEIEKGVEAESELRDVMKETEHDAKIEALEAGAMMPQPKAKPAFGGKANGKATGP